MIDPSKWKHWRPDPKKPPEQFVVCLVSVATKGGYEGEDPIPSYAMTMHYDAHTHFECRLIEPDLPWNDPSPAGGDYLHVCGDGNFTLLINLLTEAQQIGREHFDYWREEGKRADAAAPSSEFKSELKLGAVPLPTCELCIGGDCSGACGG